MKKVIKSLIVLVALTMSSYGAGVKITGEKVYPPHKKIVLKASFDSDKATYLWNVEGLSEENYEKIGGTLYVWAPPGKTYRVLITAIDFEAKRADQTSFSFKVDGATPTPPDPDPIDPPPVPPFPEKLLKDSKEAFDKDTTPDKLKKVRTLSLIYSQAALNTVHNKGIKTAGMLEEIMQATAKTYLKSEDLPSLRKGTLQAYMKEKLPSAASTVLTDDLRKTYEEVYGKIASVLNSLAGQGE